MSTSLYDLSVGSYLQILSGLKGVLAKGAEFANENNIDVDGFVRLKIHDDMLPMLFQIISVQHHSIGAIEGIKAGLFSPPNNIEKTDYQGLVSIVDEAESSLKSLTEEEVNECSGKTVLFKMGSLELPFTAENFVMSFSLPNLNFHAATAYDLLRAEGVSLGKQDFLGKMRIGV